MSATSLFLYAWCCMVIYTKSIAFRCKYKCCILYTKYSHADQYPSVSISITQRTHTHTHFWLTRVCGEYFILLYTSSLMVAISCKNISFVSINFWLCALQSEKWQSFFECVCVCCFFFSFVFFLSFFLLILQCLKEIWNEEKEWKKEKRQRQRQQRWRELTTATNWKGPSFCDDRFG